MKSRFVVAYGSRNRYLHGNYDDGAPSGGRITYVRLFSLVAIFILIVACVNGLGPERPGGVSIRSFVPSAPLFCPGSHCHQFLGLFGLGAFTAEKRRKEIGIRKVG